MSPPQKGDASGKSNTKAAARALGKALREARTARGLTQGQLAILTEREAWPVSREEISALECGRHLPRYQVLYTLARVLDLEPSVLLRFGGDPAAGREENS